MKWNIPLSFCLMLFAFSRLNAQSIDEALATYNENRIPYITVNELKESYDDYIILDTRRLEEYEVSHLPGAIWVGEELDAQLMTNIPEDAAIVVYCTIGVRSEEFGTNMTEMGYKNVKNLYGSIFLWKDSGFKVVDKNGAPTEQVHVYSKEWGVYLKTGEKVH
jgi:rhodanese-related sulfurtransferase